jgi:poly-gamma-glutamate capsule biosynthesis protein CapA/YwtB (metallophosphatase superfamily)
MIPATKNILPLLAAILLPACATVRTPPPLDTATEPVPDAVSAAIKMTEDTSDASMATAPRRPERISIAAVGDIMMGSCYPEPNLPPDDGRRLFDDCREILSSADLAFGNLEGPLCDQGSPAKISRSGRAYVFRTPSCYAALLAEAGFDVMSLANNHANDFGPPGAASTRAALDQQGIRYSGKDGSLAVFDLGGTSAALVALAAGGPPRSVVHPAGALKEIDSLAGAYDLLIVSVHGGAEGKTALHIRPGPESYLNEPRGDLISFARQAIDRGADLVIGHGPHVPRALEVYRDRLIAYSLGNFCTYGGMNLSGESGLAPLLWAELAPDGRLLDFRIHSFIQHRPGGPAADPLDRAARLMEQLSREDFPHSHPYRPPWREVPAGP